MWCLGLVSFPLYDTIALFSQQRNEKDEKMLAEFKAKEKEAKDAENFEKQVKRLEYQRKIQQMDMETMIKIRERQQYIKDNYKKSSDGLTGN